MFCCRYQLIKWKIRRYFVKTENDEPVKFFILILTSKAYNSTFFYNVLSICMLSRGLSRNRCRKHETANIITMYLIFYTFSETSLCLTLYCICIFVFSTGSVLLFVFFPFCICICFQQVRYYVEHCSLGDWLVLYQMARNMNKRFFAEFLYVLARFHSRSYKSTSCPTS